MGCEFASLTYNYVNDFSCLGDKCPDTCCQGWGMQLDQGTFDKYEKEAPELIEVVVVGEDHHIMKRDESSDFCVKYTDGICSIHEEYGEDLLGDACHFYPRATRRYNSQLMMSASLSCPEVARLVLFSEAPFAITKNIVNRIPYSVKDYLPESLSAEDAVMLIVHMVDIAGNTEVTPERILTRLVTVGKSFEHVDSSKWIGTVDFLFSAADDRLLSAELDPMDPYHLIKSILLLSNSFPRRSEKLVNLIEIIAKKLEVKLDWENSEIITGKKGFTVAAKLQKLWQKKAEKKLAPILRRWIQAQLSAAGFPFSGFGNTVSERMIILVVRFSLVKLGLMCHLKANGDIPSEEEIVHIVQTFSRFIDHLASPTLSMEVYQEFGWRSEQRLRALVGDI